MKRLLILMLAAAMLIGCQNSRDQHVEHEYRTLPEQDDRQVERARALHAQALEQLDAGELDAAEALLRKALTADITFGPAHNTLGRVYFEQGKLYLAAWEFEYAVKTMPNHPEPKNNLGLVLETARQLDEAIDHYRQAHAMEPDNVEILGNLLRARLDRGDTGRDIQDLLRELILKDTRPDWLNWAREKHAMLSGRHEGSPGGY